MTRRRTRRTTRRVCDLPKKLIGEILTRIPITSLSAVRSTCKSWDALTKRWVLGEAAAATHQFLGFMIMGSKLRSLRFRDGEEEGLVDDIYIKQVDLLNEVEICNVFHCDGLLLCVASENSKLVVWNPYLGQTRWIRPRTRFHRLDTYAIGYDINRNHKILRFVDYNDGGEAHISEFDIYELSSNTWRVLHARLDWVVEYQPGVSVKGNAYFFVHEKLGPEFDVPVYPPWENELSVENFLICFDFTTERFGPHLPLPFHCHNEDTVTLSCVREEQLAVLYQKEGRNDNISDIVEIWVTTTIEPDSVSWSKFLKVVMRPFALTGVRFDSFNGGSFFIDEEQKVAVVFDLDGYLPTTSGRADLPRYYTAYIIGEDGYFKPVRLGKALGLGFPDYSPKFHRVCSSSYLPSLVQVKQPRKRKERDVQTCISQTASHFSVSFLLIIS